MCIMTNCDAENYCRGLCKRHYSYLAKLDTKAVDEYVKLTGELPAGVERRERKKTLVIKRKGEQ